MTDHDSPTKLVMMIVSDRDADDLMATLVERSFTATKVGSSGGFLRRGNVTIFAGVTADQVETVVDIVHEICPQPMELVPVQTLPFIADNAFATEPVQVRAGGAVVFVLNVERFERA